VLALTSRGYNGLVHRFVRSPLRESCARVSLAREPVRSGFQRSNVLLVLGVRLRRKAACAHRIRLAKRQIRSAAERRGLVPQLVFKTSTAS